MKKNVSRSAFKNVELIRSMIGFGVLVSLFAGCTTTDYDPLIAKDRIKKLEQKVEELESKLAQQAESKKPIQPKEVVGKKETSPAPLTSEPNEPRQAAKPEIALGDTTTNAKQPIANSEPNPNLRSVDEIVKTIEQKSGFIRRNGSGAIVEVDLTDAKLSGAEISELGQLTDLEKLILNGANTGPEVYDIFPRLTKLTHLEFERSSPTPIELEKLKKASRLSFLQLFRADLSTDAVKTIATFPALEQLRVGQTRVGDEELIHLKGLKTLKAIDLSDCNRVSDKGLEYLSEIPGISFIKVWGPQITDQGMDSLAKMKNLKTIGLNDTKVTDDGIKKLAGLTQLSEVHLFRTSVGDVGIEVLAKLPKVNHLNLRGTGISDRGMEALSALPGLEKLDLSETNSPGITEASGTHFEKMKNLKQLNLWSTATNDKLVASIVKLNNLTWLNLDNTKISDDGIASLQAMPQLQWLHIGSNRITDRELKVLLGLKKLKYLNVSHTGMTQDAFFDLDDELSPKGCEVIGP